MKLCVLDAWHPDDPALVTSHWFAEKTVIALRRAFPDDGIQFVSGDEVDRARVSVELQQEHQGFAYFGHGSERRLSRHGAVLVGVEEVRFLRDRWFHAFACLSGDTLCHDAAEAGAAAYLGYKTIVNVHWEVLRLPEALSERLEVLVTVATLQLAHGERSRRAIRSSVRQASLRLIEWLDMNEEACSSIPWYELTGLKVLAVTLHRDLELEGIAVLD
ncbi:hypothetical protein [Nannocystis punicea]|uniref:Uncharacterized protein n=1 Tax=Nannocystis punicea TaxID=2995304 RepID=A0ABY7GYF2_9BACT|nr:hypothetical protein [Nannocystis poenicansa]WAS91910.1 hypothetical protein O0S08_37485 [Nannocystis poenicansa]